MMLTIAAQNVVGLDEYSRYKFGKLIDTYNKHSFKNAEKKKYYEGKITLGEVNLGLALPDGMRGLEIGCAWGAKTVDVLAARSMFDGFVGINGNEVEDLTRMVIENKLIAQYMKACRDELEFGSTFCTLSAGDSGVKIRFHSPMTAAALWDGEKNRIDCGFAIIDMNTVGDNDLTLQPTLINLYTDDCVWVLACDGVLRHTNTGWDARSWRL